MKDFNEEQRNKIVELLNEIRNITNTNNYYIEYNFSTDSFFSMSYEHLNLIILHYSQELSKDVVEKLNIIYDNLYDYYNNLGINNKFLYNYANYIIMILHCLGNTEHRMIFNDKHVLYKIDFAVKLMLKGSLNKNDNDLLPYEYEEIYSKQFTYKWFPIIWDKLKDGEYSKLFI